MKRLEFNNEIIDGQSTVADNLAKSNRNFMLLKEILGSGASSQDIQNMLETISQTYVKTEDIVNNLSSSDTNKPVSALQAKNLKQDITNLTGQLQQLNQSVSSLTQSLNQNISNLTQQLNQNVSSLTQRLDNKVEYYDNASNNVDLTNKAKNTICTRPYIMTINEVTRKALGIPDTGGVYWGNILCFPNPNSSGYAYQIFYSMVSGFSCKRFAHGTLWSDWTEK